MRNNIRKKGLFFCSRSKQHLGFVVVVVVVLLFYVHGKHLKSCQDGQLT